MRILRVRTRAFGALRDLDTGPERLPGLVVVEGRNEAGKSTFFELVTTLLYGFYPANRDAHPYAPWDGGVPEAGGVVLLADESSREIQRRLRSSPQGSLILAGVEEPLRNRTLPFVEHVPQAVFRHVFALGLSELAGLEGESWSAVQDRLLGGMGASDLRSAREVADELEEEAGRLWKNNRRGTQEVRVLEERVAELRRRRREADEEESEIRRISAELSGLREELDAVRREREAVRIHLERYESLLPVRERLLRVDELAQQAGNPETLRDLLPAPGGRRQELKDRIAALDRDLQELQVAEVEPRALLDAFTGEDRGILDAEEDIESLVVGQKALESIRARATELERELHDTGLRLDSGVRKLLDRPLDGELRSRILDVSVPTLHTAIRELAEARSSLAALDGTPREAPPARSDAPLWMPLAVTLAGVVLLFLAPAAEGNTLLAAGTACLLAGLAFLYHWTRSRARFRGMIQAWEDRQQEVAERLQDGINAVEEARNRVSSLLAPLGPGEGVADPGPEFPPQLERLQDLVRDEASREPALEAARREIDRLEAMADPLRNLLGPEESTVDAATAAHLLSRALRSGMARREAAQGAERELERLQRRKSAVLEERAERAADLHALEERLSALGGGDVEHGVERAEEMVRAATKARQILEELERMHPDLDQLRARIADAEARGEDWIADPDALAGQRARGEALADCIGNLQARIEGLARDQEHLRTRATLDELDGEIEALERRAGELAAHRDRLWTLGRIVRQAERQVREEHQPAILQEAGRILARLTGGRYDRLLLAGRDGRSFHVRGPAAPTPLPIEHPLSAGTREQVYLALRLAILDQLDRAGERLPLLLDEVLVNWDPVRREAGLAVLQEMSRRRQCFFFTCHPAMADRLEAHGARRITLDPP